MKLAIDVAFREATLYLHDGRTIGPAYVYKIDASRHPTDTVLGLIERDQTTTHEVWESEIKYGQSSDAHCHGKGKRFRWHSGTRCPECAQEALPL